MTIDEAIKKLSQSAIVIGCEDWMGARDLALETMRKYQKIEDIYYHQTGRALEDSLRSVIEDGKID